MRALVYILSITTLLLFCNTAAIATPISLWNADGNAYDSVGSNDGTLINGATFSPGEIGQAFSLDGANDYVEISDHTSLDIINAITISAWINPTVASSNRIVDKISAGFGDGYLLDILGGKLRLIVDHRSLNAGPFLSTGTFQHVAGVYDGQVIRLYLDGVQIDSEDFGSFGAIPTNNLTMRIGADSDGSNLFSGLIDEVQIFDHALNASEIGRLAAVPEPATMLLLGTGLIGLAGFRRKKFKK